jgi:hypothetical protein
MPTTGPTQVVLTPTQKTARLATMTAPHNTLYSQLSATGKTCATLAAATGLTLEQTEHMLGALVDESLAKRSSTGDRTLLGVSESASRLSSALLHHALLP